VRYPPEAAETASLGDLFCLAERDEERRDAHSMFRHFRPSDSGISTPMAPTGEFKLDRAEGGTLLLSSGNVTWRIEISTKLQSRTSESRGRPARGMRETSSRTEPSAAREESLRASRLARNIDSLIDQSPRFVRRRQLDCRRCQPHRRADVED